MLPGVSAKLQLWIQFHSMSGPGHSPGLGPSHIQSVKPLRPPLVMWHEGWRHASSPAEVARCRWSTSKGWMPKVLLASLLATCPLAWKKACWLKAQEISLGLLCSAKPTLERFTLHSAIWYRLSIWKFWIYLDTLSIWEYLFLLF